MSPQIESMYRLLSTTLASSGLAGRLFRAARGHTEVLGRNQAQGSAYATPSCSWRCESYARLMDWQGGDIRELEPRALPANFKVFGCRVIVPSVVTGG